MNVPASVPATAPGDPPWEPICRYDVLLPERGVAALVGDRQIAVFRTFSGTLHAIDNRDPFTGQNVLSRGVVGTKGDAETVASPLLKQVFDLRTGVCMTDDTKRVPVHEPRVRDGMVEVRLRSSVGL